MNGLEKLSYRRFVIALGLLIVVGGVVVAILPQNNLVGGLSAGPASFGASHGGSFIVFGPNGSADEYGTSNGVVYGGSQVITTATMTAAMTTEMSSTTVYLPPAQTTSSGSSSSPTTQPSGATTATQSSGSIEYFANVSMISSSPPVATSKIVNIAYETGGYVAYSSSNANFSFVVIRVPAAEFQSAMNEIQSAGNVTNTARWSNDVTVQYTDLNATLKSLLTEQASLLTILNSSTKVNNTLAIETQLQSVNQQIDLTESQILETQRLITYSTISVTINISSKAIKAGPLTLTLSATPKSGESPLGVTFSAVVQGGQSPYVVNYNFGDGTSQQGQIIIHQYYGSGDYNASVTVTDSKGNVAMRWVLIHVTSPPTKGPFSGFIGTVVGLFVSVIEGIAEVAVVVIPIGLVALAIIVPLRRRSKIQKETVNSG